MPAPPGETAVIAAPLTVALIGLLLTLVNGSPVKIVTPFSSSNSKARVWVCVALKVADVIEESPDACTRIRVGMQVLNEVGVELTEATLAKMPVTPGFFAVTAPFVSTLATLGSSDVQLNWPTWLVMSVLPLKALAVS